MFTLLDFGKSATKWSVLVSLLVLCQDFVCIKQWPGKWHCLSDGSETQH